MGSLKKYMLFVALVAFSITATSEAKSHSSSHKKTVHSGAKHKSSRHASKPKKSAHATKPKKSVHASKPKKSGKVATKPKKYDHVATKPKKSGKVATKPKKYDRVATKPQKSNKVATKPKKSGYVAPTYSEPSVHIGSRQMDHIRDRHWHNAAQDQNTSRFFPSMTQQKLEGMASKAIREGNSKPSYQGNGNMTHDYTFKKPVGLSTTGQKVNNLRIVTAPNGDVITAFPRS